MGQVEADPNASPMEALMDGLMSPDGGADQSKSEARGQQNTPFWMEAEGAQSFARTGVTAQKGSGVHTLLFFGLITVVVAAAGAFGIAMWGPEEEIKNRTHLASDPPPPPVLPSLPPEQPAESASAVLAAAEPPPVDSATAAAAAGKKAKKSFRPAPKKH
jgi:hypothetical protein